LGRGEREGFTGAEGERGIVGGGCSFPGLAKYNLRGKR